MKSKSSSYRAHICSRNNGKTRPVWGSVFRRFRINCYWALVFDPSLLGFLPLMVIEVQRVQLYGPLGVIRHRQAALWRLPRQENYCEL